MRGVFYYWFVCAVSVICILISVGSAAEEPLPAFPGAEGYGAATAGGRGGRVVKVTNLNPKGPGSLQWACMQKGPIIVVFEVSGVIKPPNWAKTGWYLSIRRNNITIAGQTAPGAGITIEGVLTAYRADRSVPEAERPVVEGREAHDMIIRFLRMRPTTGRGNRRGLEFLHCRRAIADHVSICWGLDECFDPGYGVGDENFTLQWSCIEESDIHLEGPRPHNYAMTTGWHLDGNLTMHHNLLAHHIGRAPNIGCYRAEFSNNVIYNCGPGETRIEWFKSSAVRDKKPLGNYNMVGNWWRTGPGGIVASSIAAPPLTCSRVGLVPKSKIDRARYFFDGNRFAREGYVGTEKYSVSQREKYKIVAAEPFALTRPKTHSAEEAYELVLAQSGCLPRDSVCARTIAEVRTQTGGWGQHGPDGGLMEGLTPGKAPVDADDDGMPDAWEKAHNLDPKDPADNNKIVPAGASPGDRHKGYTYIEYYINELADFKVAAALTCARVDPKPAKPWDKPARQLTAWGRKYKSLDEMVKVIRDQNPKAAGEGKSRRKIANAGWYAVQQLSRMGEKAVPAVPELIKALEAADGDAQATAFAAWALGVIGPAAADGVPALIKALKRKQGMDSGKWGFPPYGYIAWALGKIGMTDEQLPAALPLLAKLLTGKDRRAWANAAWALSRLDDRAAPAQAALLTTLGTGKRGTGYFSARALANIGEPAVPGLIKVLGGGKDLARANAARALALIGPKAGGAKTALIECLKKSPSGSARGLAAAALGEIAPGEDAVVEALGKALADSFLDVRVNAAKTLGKCSGPAADKAVTALANALGDKRREVRRAAALALGKIGKRALPTLDKAVGSDDNLVRKYAARAIGNTGKDAGGGVAPLIKALADTDAEVRREAVWSLGLIGPVAKGAAGALKKSLNDEDYVVRYAAAEALKRIQD